MQRLLLIPTLSLLLWGCTKSDLINNTEVGDIEQSTHITIGVDDESLTRSTVVKDEATMASVGLYCAHTAQEPWSTSTQFEKMLNSRFNYNSTTLAWDYDELINVVKHPAWGHKSITEKYTFYAYSPHSSINSGIVPTIESGALQIAYTVPTDFSEKADLLVAIPRKDIYPQTGGKVTMEFEHVLTKVTMSAKMDDATTSEHLGRYTITSFTMHHIETSSSLVCSAASGIGEWNNGSYGDLTALDFHETPTLLSADYQPIMDSDEALFMIPQPIEASTNENGRPSIEITITDNNDPDIIYRTDKLLLPSYLAAGWKMGQAIDIRFEFTVDPSMVIIPMSITAKLLDWTEQTVDKEVEPNIYAWLSTNKVDANTTTELKLYTNGEVTDAKGMSAVVGTQVEDYCPISVTAGEVGTDSPLEVTIKNANDKIIKKIFYIKVI